MPIVIPDTGKFEGVLSRAVRAAINDRIQSEVEQIVSEAHNKLNMLIPEIVAGVMITFQKRIAVEVYKHEIIIRIEDSGKEGGA